MSSRVEQENQARQAEAERLQKKVERESRDQRATDAGRESFARLVKSSQQGQQEASAKGEQARGEARQGDEHAGKAARQAHEGERNARMARGGVVHQSRVMEQARSFQGVLQSQQGQTREADQGRVQARDQGKAHDRVERDDRDTAIVKAEQRRDADAEQARVEARDSERPNAAIQGDSGGGDMGQQRGDGGGAAAALGKARSAAADGAQAVREVKQIPPELLEKLVSAVYLGVNQKGLKEFQIELKDGPLQGAVLRITAEAGKVGLRFEGLGADEKRLVEASKGELMRRLGSKGLSLARLDVV